MRRTSRLVLLLGIFLAALTFVVVLFARRPAEARRTSRWRARPRRLSMLMAAVDIPLGTVITRT